MASPTNIEWTEFNWNPLSGCSRKSAGCENCYAEKMTKRLAAMGQEKYQGLLNEQGRFNGIVKFSETDLLAPLKRKKPTTYFVNSMSDLFHEKVQDEWLDQAFAVMALTPQHTHQCLTKRADRMRDYMNDPYTRVRIAKEIISICCDEKDDKRYLQLSKRAAELTPEDCALANHVTIWPLPNVWLGVSVEDQKTADERIPHLLDTPAAVRWVSYEPALAGVNFTHYLYNRYLHGGPYHEYNNLDWIVVGGESGPNARPFDIQWARDIIARCKAADVPVFVKQLGAVPVHRGPGEPVGDPFPPYLSYYKLNDRKGGDMAEWPEDLRVREMPAKQV